jgi:hypothetical protein
MGLADKHDAFRPVEFAQVLRHHGVLALASQRDFIGSTP